ncbi:hypothetical protein VTN96DRAFT_5921 [Rasamsonia emersonii]
MDKNPSFCNTRAVTKLLIGPTGCNQDNQYVNSPYPVPLAGCSIQDGGHLIGLSIQPRYCLSRHQDLP